MSSFVGKIVRLGALRKLAHSIPGSYALFRHLLRVGLSNHALMHKTPLLFPTVALLALLFARNLCISLVVQVSFITVLLGSNLIKREEKLKKFSPILRELFHYKNFDVQCKIATLHLGLSVVLYSFNWLVLIYYTFGVVSR